MNFYRNPPTGKGTRPHQSYEHISKIDFPSLGERGRYLLIDVDNTLAAKGSAEIAREVRELLAELRKDGHILGICLVSNVVFRNKRRERRVQAIAELLDAKWHCAFIPHCKPKPHPYIEGMRLLGSKPENTVMIGDQLLTDVRGANRLGLHTIWVKPFSREPFYTGYKRRIEKWLIKRW